VRLLGGQAWPTDWSRDGRYVVGHVLNAETLLDIWAADVQADPMTMRYLIRAPGDQQDQRISPDGRWIAYASTERSETFEVYVRRFPEGPGIWRVSTAGGRLPTWTADGRELLYVAPDGSLMRVAVTPGRDFSALVPQPLFRSEALRRGFNRNAQFGRPYDTLDGRRFLISVPISDPPPAPIVVVLNWERLVAGSATR
jgi:WD40-like Beta Propeller Repeat